MNLMKDLRPIDGARQDFVVEKWDEVSVCPEFEQCCKEVAAGE